MRLILDEGRIDRTAFYSELAQHAASWGAAPPCDYTALGWEVLLDQAKSWSPEAFTPQPRVCLSCKYLRQKREAATTRCSGDVTPIEPPDTRPRDSALALANWGLRAWGPFCRSEQLVPDTVTIPGSRLVAQEVFAGSGAWSQACRDHDIHVLEPIELYSDPLAREGPREAHDLLRPEVQRRVLQSIASGEANVWGFEPVCTSFCSWQRLNGGTRTTEHPEGVPPILDGERAGNALARFTAKAFACALDSGLFAWVENPAPDGLYPSMWDLPEWRRILKRRDVIIIPFDLCEHGHGPLGRPRRALQEAHVGGGTRLPALRLPPGAPVHRPPQARPPPGLGPGLLRLALQGGPGLPGPVLQGARQGHPRGHHARRSRGRPLRGLRWW